MGAATAEPSLEEGEWHMSETTDEVVDAKPENAPVFSRPIMTYDDALDEGAAWGAYYAGDGPKPAIVAAPSETKQP